MRFDPCPLLNQEWDAISPKAQCLVYVPLLLDQEGVGGVIGRWQKPRKTGLYLALRGFLRLRGLRLEHFQFKFLNRFEVLYVGG